ncbi:TetR family transcriptional regulator [Paenibacillus sp. MER 180]|uniref:TetR/AcrR family transcriptional regulator n=1 Tax=unclassified Paenibacillus TaxID=185978 RepID=UPI0008065787|nr:MULTISPECIES: TetR/AcrR family transcriptional regulator [unclassified Paenibacillus]MCM3293854.1 TetR family transcriptional regulator [Paenibacillus sp. MER 180]OBY77405.1 TetR family transcriptional regulator [Paenibacillus sp. KS1]
MPKIVDHEKRKRLVAEAAIRVIQREGLDHATVRTVAVEAGLSVGSLRHYFSSQVELFAFCMNIFREQVEERLSTLVLDDRILPSLLQLLMQFMPIDEDRRTEMEAWLSFTSKTLTHSELQHLSHELNDGIYYVTKYVIDLLQEKQLAKPDLDYEMEIEKLYALLDGLALHLILQPQRLQAERVERILNDHLHSLCT